MAGPGGSLQGMVKGLGVSAWAADEGRKAVKPSSKVMSKGASFFNCFVVSVVKRGVAEWADGNLNTSLSGGLETRFLVSRAEQAE